MSDFLVDIVKKILAKTVWLVKVPRPVWISIAILFVTGFFIMFRTNEYLSVPGSELALRFGQFGQCEITFKNNINILYYQIYPDVMPAPGEQMAINPWTQSINNSTNTLTITNPWYVQNEKSPGKLSYRVFIETESATRFDISSVSLNNEPVYLKDFVAQNLASEKYEFVHYRYIRKYLAQIVYLCNDEVSNWILTSLSAGIVLFLILLFDMELKTVVTDRYFEIGLEKLLKEENRKLSKTEQKQIAFDRFHDICLQRNGRFVFLQALGPALGFILTVSSLIASLDPNTFSGSGTDLDAFLNGIHVALVSTFLGLLLRLLALEAARVNSLLLRRAYLTMSVGNSPNGEIDSSAREGDSS